MVLSAPATPVDAGISVNIDSGNKPSPNLDAGTPNSPAQDAGVTPEPRKRPTLRALENNPIRGGGCGCQSSRPQQKSKDAFSLLLLFGLITLSARRRTSGKDID